MNMKTIFLMLVLGSACAAQAQQATPIFNSNSQIIGYWQNASNPGGVGKEAIISQSGSGNNVNYRSAGQNKFQANQNGSGNEVNLDLSGGGNEFLFSQQGNNNKALLPNTMSSGKQFELNQTGNGNELTRDGASVGTLPMSMKIEQTGGMRLIITTSTFTLPNN
jgi:hypothetical protein